MDNNISVMGVVGLLPNSKEQVESFSNQLVDSIKSGSESALKLKAQFKFLEKVMEKVDSEIKDEVLTEAMKYGKKFEAFGYNIEISENLAVKYDYSQCNDPVYNSILDKIFELIEAKKKREKWLQNCAFNVECVNPDTGETYTVNPPTKTSTTGLKFTAI